jgi:hypothetical protein
MSSTASTMANRGAERLLLRLPRDQRLELAEALVESLDDDLDEDERQRLHAALDEAQADIKAGRTRPAAEVLADLRRDL